MLGRVSVEKPVGGEMLVLQRVKVLKRKQTLHTLSGCGEAFRKERQVGQATIEVKLDFTWALTHWGWYHWNPRHKFTKRFVLSAKNDRGDRRSVQSDRQRKFHVPAWVWFWVSNLSWREQQPRCSTPSQNYCAKAGEQSGGCTFPNMHPRSGIAGAEGVRVVVSDHPFSWGERTEEEISREAADERVYGLGASCAQQTGGPISSSTQRRA